MLTIQGVSVKHRGLLSLMLLCILGALALFATTAMSHTQNMSVTAVCQTDGQYKVTYTLNYQNGQKPGEAFHRTGTTTFHGGWNKNTWSDWQSLGTLNQNSGSVSWDVFLPGTTKVAPWEYAYIRWSDNYITIGDTRPENLKGDCKPPPTQVPVPAQPETVDACGPNNIAWKSIPSDTEYVRWELKSTGQLVAALKGENLIWADSNSSAPKMFELPADSNVPCVLVCEEFSSHHTTDLSTWDLSQTRSAGHSALVSDGLHVWTDDNSSQAKAAGYFGVNFPLTDVGTDFGIDFSMASPGMGVKPSLQIVTTGAVNGILVYEPDYYGVGNLWSNADYGISAGMGYTSFGTLSDILAVHPDLQVAAIGYSLGSGVKGDFVISKIKVGCVEYTFGLPAVVELPTPQVKDACGPNNAEWIVPENSETVRWELKDNGELVAYAIGEHNVLPNGKKKQNFGAAPDSNEPCPPPPVKVCPDGQIGTPPNCTTPEPPPPVTPPTPPAPPVVVPPAPPVAAQQLVGVKKISVQKRVRSGGKVVWRISVRNLSDKPVTLTIRDRLSGGVSLLRASGKPKFKSGTLTWKVRVKAHSNRILTVVTRIAADAPRRVCNTATIVKKAGIVSVSGYSSKRCVRVQRVVKRVAPAVTG